MNEFVNKHGKDLFWLIGFIIPILLILAQMISGNVTSPLTILAFTWFGIAILLYIGTEEE